MKKTILVVEDTESLLFPIRAKLENAGFDVVATTNAEEALFILRRGKVDLVWLDHYLPHKSGLELMAIMKMEEAWKDIPVFLVSNSANLDEVYSYLNLGLNKYYVKSEAKLQDIIEEIKITLGVK